MSREFVIDTQDMRGIDWLNCTEDDDKIIHCKDHQFACGNFEIGGKKIVNIYVCKECGLRAIFSIPRVMPGQTLRGTISPFASEDTFNKYMENRHVDATTFSKFLYCDEMITKDILE